MVGGFALTIQGILSVFDTDSKKIIQEKDQDITVIEMVIQITTTIIIITKVICNNDVIFISNT